MELGRSEENGKIALVRYEGRAAIAAALLDGTGCEPFGPVGRGAMRRFPLESGFGVVRTCWRGGLIRYLVKDGYFLVNRPLCEFRVHVRIYEMGLAAPEPLGVCWRRSGIEYRGALATRELEAVNLCNYLSVPNAVRPEIVRRAGAVIREFHDAGVFHADLQARNILVNDEQVYLIDFDRARLVRRMSGLSRARNLLRLRRSLDKNGFSREYYDLILEGYGAVDAPGWLGRLYGAKGRLSDSVFGQAEK